MDEKIRRKNIFIPDKIARMAFCVGGLFYPIIFFKTSIFSAEHPNKSHSLHTDRESIKTYFSTIPKSLIYKLYLFYESDYIAFGYHPPWSWLEIEPPSDSFKTFEQNSLDFLTI